MEWILLFVAGLFEAGWAIGLKYTDGFTRLWPTVWTVLAMVVSLGLLGVAMKALPVGTAYAVWVGGGGRRHRRPGHRAAGGTGKRRPAPQRRADHRRDRGAQACDPGLSPCITMHAGKDWVAA